MAGEGCPSGYRHSLRRANITWRQEVGGSSIEASKIAGHANTKITEEYTIVQLRRQEELTRRIQEKRAKAAQRNQKGLQAVKKEAAVAAAGGVDPPYPGEAGQGGAAESEGPAGREERSCSLTRLGGARGPHCTPSALKTASTGSA